MDRCEHCESFVPAGVACPECGGRAARPVLSRIAKIAGGAGVAITLMACYGMAYAPPAEQGSTPNCAEPSEDQDGDSYCGEHDCDESDPSVQVCPT
jgi:hypothetical protein